MTLQENFIEEIIALPKRTVKAIVDDPVKTAEAIDLIYVNDNSNGILRKKKGKDFKYYFNEKEIKDIKILERINSLVIPPAWENVWICPLANGHLQATGLDTKKRKQYKYHPHWNSLRNHTKFFRLYEFGKALPRIREQLNRDLTLPGLPLDKVLATIVSLMERTSIRIGNNFYEKLYGSFGLTTLKNKHVVISGNEIKFSFRGKKGIDHKISIQNKKLSLIVKKCKDIPGKELFQYYNEDGTPHNIDSGMVNDYIRKISSGDFTAKDFRTWAGSVHALIALKDLGGFENDAEAKRKIIEALDSVSKHLGNTRTVCKKYYVHPTLISMYENNSLDKYMKEWENDPESKELLTPEEIVLLKILKAQ